MSTVMGFPHEFRSNGPRRNRKTRQKNSDASTSQSSGSGSGITLPPVALEFSDGEDWIEKLLAFMAALWAKIMELEQKLVAAIERMTTVAPMEQSKARTKDY